MQGHQHSNTAPLDAFFSETSWVLLQHSSNCVNVPVNVRVDMVSQQPKALSYA